MRNSSTVEKGWKYAQREKKIVDIGKVFGCLSHRITTKEMYFGG